MCLGSKLLKKLFQYDGSFENPKKMLNLIDKKIHCIHNFMHNFFLSFDVASGSEITPCNKIDKPLVVYRFTENVMMSITILRT